MLTVIPLSLGRIAAGAELSARIVLAVKKTGLRVKRGDVVAVSSKIVSISEGRLARVSNVEPSTSARRLARRLMMNPSLVQVVLNEADQVLGGVKGTLLTVKNGILTANAGVDEKNAPKDHVVLWPKDPERSARNLRDRLAAVFYKELSVIIVDSHVTPLRLGASGVALAVAGSPSIQSGFERLVRQSDQNYTAQSGGRPCLLRSRCDGRRHRIDTRCANPHDEGEFPGAGLRPFEDASEKMFDSRNSLAKTKKAFQTRLA